MPSPYDCRRVGNSGIAASDRCTVKFSPLVVGLVGALAGNVLDVQAEEPELRGPALAVASNFGQGYLGDLMDQALAWGVTDFRDAVYWDRVEGPDGQFSFALPETTYPDRLAEAGARMSLTVNNGHPAYDNGATPLSPQAVAGFAYHAAETLLRFPAIDAIEVGNEFNTANFVSGPLKESDLDARAEAYVALLEAVATRARRATPDVRIIGGGVHSIPTGYLAKLIELGAVEHMDTLALHPYSTPVEHYAKQIAVMRRLPELATIPVEITEFGIQSEVEAPGKLLRSHCQYGLAGASRLAWFALNDRGDGFTPVIARDGRVTDAGQAYRFVQDELANRPLQDVSPDPFTYACLYDDRKLVIWGMPRDLKLESSDLRVFDAAGRPLEGSKFGIAETAPLVIVAPESLSLDADVTLAPQKVLADSYHGFAYPEAAEAEAAPGGFLREVIAGDGAVGLQTRPGQDRPGRPWTPWLGIPENADVRALPLTLLPSGDAANPVKIRHRYAAAEPQVVSLDVLVSPSDRSADGVALTVLHNDQVLATWEGLGQMTVELPDVALEAGDRLDIVLGPGETSTGDVTEYRFTLRSADARKP